MKVTNVLACIILVATVASVVTIFQLKKDVVTGNEIGSQKYSNADVQRALNISTKIKAMRRGKEDPTLNTQIGALKQPSFPGAVGTEGAIVTFDEQYIPVHGITTRTFNRDTGTHYEVRDLTPTELTAASKHLQMYYYTVLSAEDRRSIKTIVVFSENFKMAVCESVLNLRKDRDYFMKANRTAKTAGIYMKQAGTATLIAEDKVYYSRD